MLRKRKSEILQNGEISLLITIEDKKTGTINKVGIEYKDEEFIKNILDIDAYGVDITGINNFEYIKWDRYRKRRRLIREIFEDWKNILSTQEVLENLTIDESIKFHRMYGLKAFIYYKWILLRNKVWKLKKQ